MCLQTTISSFKEKKLYMLFDYMDVNRDGILDSEELMFFPKNLISKRKGKLGEELTAVYKEAWVRICDANNLPRDNQSLTRNQWLAGLKVLMNTTWFAETAIPSVTRIYFDSLDHDHDDTISLKEWREHNHNRGLTDENLILSTFNRLDADGDGRISREAIKHAILQFYFGEDPSDDYSFLYAVK